MEKLMLAMSGGVDSTAALLLLKDKYEVVGATLSLYPSETSRQGIADAKSAAEKYGVPHYVFDYSELFKEKVIDPFISAYMAGETPNPCVFCNRNIKFGELLKAALSLGCTRLATGHYARAEWDAEKKRYLIKKAVDADGEINKKDQSYVLYTLTQEQLRHIVFPLGRRVKSDVRSFAESMGLDVSNKPDSQDICFVPDGKYAEFITDYSGIVTDGGNIVDKSGNVLGRHEGLIRYTIGQRKGMKIAHPFPLYVTEKNPVQNTITAGAEVDLYTNRLTVKELNWIAIPELSETIRVKAKTRYRQTEQPCTVSPLPENKAVVEFDQPQRAVTPGQSAVFYEGDTVVGGGIII